MHPLHVLQLLVILGVAHGQFEFLLKVVANLLTVGLPALPVFLQSLYFVLCRVRHPVETHLLPPSQQKRRIRSTKHKSKLPAHFQSTGTASLRSALSLPASSHVRLASQNIPKILRAKHLTCTMCTGGT